MAYDPRAWKFVKDMNHDGSFTISDVIKWLGWFFFYPGDRCIKFMVEYTPGLAKFFEVSYRNYGGIVSATISGLFWLIVIVFIYVLISKIRSPKH